MKRFRIGVIGSGAIAQACHIPAYAASGKCDLVAVVDPEPRSLQQTRDAGFRFKKEYRDFHEMLQRETLDAVSICTPNAFHADAAISAIRRKIPVLLEKPIATNRADGQAIVAAARKHKVRVMVGFSHRFNEHCEIVKRELDKQAIGKLYMGRIRFAHGGPFPGWAKTDWFYNPKLAGGGALLDMGIHAFDLIQWFIRPLTALQAKTATLRKPIKVDDNAVILCEFGKDCLGYIEVGWTSPSGFSGVELMGDKGSIIIDYAADTSTMVTGITKPSGERIKETTVLHAKTKRGAWKREMDHFISHLGTRKPFAVGLEAGMLSLQAALASYESSRTGKRVIL